MITLLDVYRARDGAQFLYRLLAERRPEESISHRAMPTLDQHRQFMMSRPYRAWYIIENLDRQRVGSVYATKNNELGVGILKDFRRMGYAREALNEIMNMHPPLLALKGQRTGYYVAHINPQNPASIALFTGLGAKHVQNTYAFS